MRKLFAILFAFPLLAFSQSGVRQFQIVSDNSEFPKPYDVQWMQGESVQFVVTAKSGNYYLSFSNGASVVLKAWAGSITTQLYAQKTGTVNSATQGKATVELLANEANFTPTGRYNYAIGAYDGTNYMGVIAQGTATIRAHPFGSSVGYVGVTSPFPYVPTNDAAYVNGITNIIAGTNITVSRSGRQVTVNSSASGGGSGTFTNVTIGTNVMTAQAIIQVESNIVLRASGGTNYFGLASTLAGAFTFNGSINANDNIEIANTKHLRFQDGGGTNTVHLAANAGRLIVTGAVDVVTGQAVPFTVNGTAPLYSQSETNAEARVARAGDTMTGTLIITGATVKVKSDSINAEFTDARGVSGVLLQTGTPSATTNSYGVIKLQNSSGNSSTYGTLYFDALVSPTGLWIKTSGTNKWNVWDYRNDGAGSGLDADLLDGLSSSAFLQALIISTEGTGNVVTNLTIGGSVITQQMGTVSGGSETSKLAAVLSRGNDAAVQSITNANTFQFAGINAGTNTYATLSMDPTNRWIKVTWTP